jgi:hypothetical protein
MKMKMKTTKTKAKPSRLADPDRCPLPLDRKHKSAHTPETGSIAPTSHPQRLTLSSPGHTMETINYSYPCQCHTQPHSPNCSLKRPTYSPRLHTPSLASSNSRYTLENYVTWAPLMSTEQTGNYKHPSSLGASYLESYMQGRPLPVRMQGAGTTGVSEEERRGMCRDEDWDVQMAPLLYLLISKLAAFVFNSFCYLAGDRASSSTSRSETFLKKSTLRHPMERL